MPFNFLKQKPLSIYKEHFILFLEIENQKRPGHPINFVLSDFFHGQHFMDRHARQNLFQGFNLGMSNSNYIAGRKSIKNCLKGRKSI